VRKQKGGNKVTEIIGKNEFISYLHLEGNFLQVLQVPNLLLGAEAVREAALTRGGHVAEVLHHPEAAAT
jgi:hypothetical protein